MSNETKIVKDASGKKLIVTRSFNAPVEKVWEAWTKSELLEKWWAPKPYRAETKTMEFKVGGLWLYAMVGPEGDKQWCRVDFKTINTGKSFTATNGFCDENGVINTDFAEMYWDNTFEAAGETTNVTVVLVFDTEEDLEKIVNLGFKEGFTMALGNLDELLA
jgi:uncharacterized protein YndB with AHSA1/START domain